jgi:hypothetical protein
MRNKKDKNKSNMNQEGGPKRTHELKRLSREKFSISRTGIIFSGKRFHLTEKHGRGIFFPQS